MGVVVEEEGSGSTVLQDDGELEEIGNGGKRSV